MAVRGGVLGAFALLFASSSSGCGPTPSNKVTGQDPSSPTWTKTQSETAINVSFGSFGDTSTVVTVTFNDDTGSEENILYTPTSRTVLAGASQMGWAYSIDSGASWTYGGKVAPPPGWSVLWGDPAITSSTKLGQENLVFISNLAVDNAHYPPGGITGGLDGYISGACIARSTDAGRNFSIWGCLSNDGQFYDGGSATADSGGLVYFAYWNYAAQNVDIWVANAADEVPNFILLSSIAPPLPPGVVIGHPQIRVGRDDPSNALWLAAPVAVSGGGASVVLLNLQSLVWSPFGDLLQGHFDFIPTPTILLDDGRELRTARQFSFDVGLGGRSVRYAVTRPSGAHYYVQGGTCDDLLRCQLQDGWSTNFVGDQFNPDVEWSLSVATGQSVWKTAYLSRQDDPGGHTVSVVQGNLANLPDGTPVLVPTTAVASHEVCGDKRGYWGDYDDLTVLPQSLEDPNPTFLRAYSDSSAGCEYMWQYTSQHLHVSAATFK